MKKFLFFSLALLVCSYSAFCQKWTVVKLDSAISFKLPKGYKASESRQSEKFMAQTAFGTIMVFKAPDNPSTTPDIEKDKQLNRFYDDYLKQVRSSTAEGIISDEKDSVLGNLKVKDFTLQVDSGSGVQYRKFRILHANDATYTFEFMFQEMHKIYATEECKRFFNSIEVSQAMEKSDQFTSEDGHKTGNKLIYIIGGAVLLIALFIFVWMRRRRTS